MAFQYLEKDELGEPTADAFAGALLTWEFQNAMISWMKAWNERCRKQAEAYRERTKL